MKPDALCSCGSGKQYKFCCGKAPGSVSVKVAFTWFLIGLLVSGITAIAWFMPGDNAADDSISPANSSFQSNSNANSNLDLLNPKPWQYDPVRNRHWHATANPHWDSGPPPNAAATNPLISKPLINQPNLSGRARPNIPNPKPWQYDPITDQHWHATANPHWDAGPPPNNSGQ